MRTQLNKLVEIAKEFVKLGVQMGMPTGFNYFDKKKDWLDGVRVIYTSPPYKVNSKSSLEDDTSFAYKDIEFILFRFSKKVSLPLDLTDEQLDIIVKEIESKLDYLRTAEGMLELKEVVDEAWNEKKWE